MFRCLALVVIPALAFSCCPPKQWEGRQYVAIGSTAKDGSSHYTEIKQNVTVDSNMRRTVIHQMLNYDGHDVHQHVLQDFGSGEQYVTNMMNGMCERTPIDSVEPGCIPMNATKVLQSYVGAGKSKVMATVYKFMMNGSIIYATMGDVGCIPLAYEAAGTTKDGGGYQMTVESFGITPGVADTSLFETPSHCPYHNPVVTGFGK